MFIDVKTKQGERLFFNLANILYITEYKGSAIIVDINGVDYVLENNLDNFLEKSLIEFCKI